MKRKGPFLTLLAGVAMTAVLFVLNTNLKTDNAAGAATQKTAGNAAATTPAPANPPTPPPAVPEPAVVPPAPRAPAPVALNVTWAGKVVGGKATIAIAAKGTQAIAYLCDGGKVEVWLKGTATGGQLTLTGAKNASLTGTFGKGRAEGTIAADGRRWTFDVGTVKKPSGLYRATADVRNARLVGGWIVLADGRQVGVVSLDGVPRSAPPLDLGSGTTTVDGTRITAGAVDPTSAAGF